MSDLDRFGASSTGRLSFERAHTFWAKCPKFFRKRRHPANAAFGPSLLLKLQIWTGRRRWRYCIPSIDSLRGSAR